MATDADVKGLTLDAARSDGCLAAVPPVTLVLNETISLVASMRKQSRWTSSSVAAILGSAVEVSLNTDESLAGRWGLRAQRANQNDNPLLIGFTRLRQDLIGLRDFHEYDTTKLLSPFLEVVKSSHTSGAVTSLALNSISKFFSYRLIHKGSLRLADAMKQLSSAITHCRFEASDSGQDEIVLLRILLLMQEMMLGCGGHMLGDESICEMMETGLSMCCQMRLSEMLRRSAEMVMQKMLQVVFLRLRELDPADDPVESSAGDAPLSTPAPTPLTSPRHGPISPAETSARTSIADSSAAAQEPVSPYGIMSIRELLRVLITILDPDNRQHTDSMRLMAFRLIEVAFEVGGEAIARHKSLRTQTCDEMCRHLFRLVRSENPLVLRGSLRVISTLIQTVRVHLKLQQELFLNYIVACLAPTEEAGENGGNGIDAATASAIPNLPRIKQLNSGRSTPVPVKERQRLGLEGSARGGDDREAMVECMGTLLRIPTYMVELFVNYDCDENLGDLCQDVIGFLCRNAFPDAANWSTTNVPPLCLDALLAYIAFMHARISLPETTSQPVAGLPEPEVLLKSKARKETIMRACAKFNEDPKQGLQFLLDNGLVDPSNETKSLASFLFSSTRINKKLLGDYISKPKHLPLLQAFVKLFDFHDKRIDEALRMLLQKFRLPGEAQQIERIVEQFASIYFATGPQAIRSSDAAFVLSYAVIMLNTDQHNPQAKKSKMTVTDFAKNLRGTNDGEDFDLVYLQQIYDEIKGNEIIMPEEHDTSASFDYAWRGLLAKVEATGTLMTCDTNKYDGAMFEATWRPLVATLTFVFASATDDAVFSRVMAGLHQCAEIAAGYNNTEAIDRIVASLARLTPLAADQLPGIGRNTSVEVDSQRVTVSDLSVAFGRDFKAQLATVLLFRICQGNLHVLRQGWRHLSDIFAALLVNSLLPQDFSPIHRYMKISSIPLPPSNKSSKAIRRNQESSFFTSLSSYLSSYASDEPPQPSDEEIESTMGTFDCVASCQLDVLRDQMLSMTAEQAEATINALLAPSKDLESPAKTVVAQYLASAEFTDSNGESAKVYDPSELLKLEIATALCVKDEASVTRFSSRLIARLAPFIQDAPSQHFLVTERIVVYLLRILLAMLKAETCEADSAAIRLLSEMDAKALKQCAVPVSYGLLDCLQVERGRKLIGSFHQTYDLLRKLSENTDAKALVFEHASLLATTLHKDNFSWLIRMFDAFAAEAAIGAGIDDLTAKPKATPPAKGQRNSPQVQQQQEEAEEAELRLRKEAVVRGCRSLELLYQMRLELQEMAQAADASTTLYWQSLLNAIKTHCLSTSKPVKLDAFKYLQRLVLSFDLSVETGPMAEVIFEETVIDLVESLQQLSPGPESGRRPKILEESKVQACSLLAKAWLHHLIDLQRASPEEFAAHWHRVLLTLAHLANAAPPSSSQDNRTQQYLVEAATESLKNVLLVMFSSSILLPGQPLYADTQKSLREEANARIDLDLLFNDYGPRSPATEKSQTDAVKSADGIVAGDKSI
ncbi:GDP/GTP exchange factor for ARF [Savitreella phatthalungensis]